MRQTQLAKDTGLSNSFISQVLSGKKKVRVWDTAKKLARATGTDERLWLEGTPAEIRTEVSIKK